MSKDANGQGSEVSEALSDERSSTEAQEEAEALLSRREKLDGESLQAVIHALLFVQGDSLKLCTYEAGYVGGEVRYRSCNC